MSWGNIGAAAATIIGGAINKPEGGVGGATSAQVQPGQTGLQYQDVIGTGITPFEWNELEEEYLRSQEQARMEDAFKQAQGQRSGGPLFAADGNSIDFKTQIAQDIFGQGIKDLMPQGILGLLLASNYLDNVDDEEKESIVPMPAYMGRPLYANEGREIEEIVVRASSLEPSVTGGDTSTSGEVGLTSEDPELAPTADLSRELEEMLTRQNTRDLLLKAGLGVLTDFIKNKNKKSTVSPRRSVTPLPGGGIGKRQAPYPEPKGSGITPFTYQGVAGGGALGRSMFAQNYMPHGGAMQGPGGPKDDLIPVMASDGEYMLSKAAVDQAGGGNHTKGIARLEQFNRLGNRRYG